MTVRARPRRQARSSRAPTSPTSRGTGSRPSGRCWRRCRRRGASAATRCSGSPSGCASTCASRWRPRRRRSGGRPSTRAVDLLERELDAAAGRVRGRTEVPAVDGAGVPAPRGLRAVARHGRADPARRWPAAGSTTSSAAGFARYSVDADWVVPHFEKMLYDNALLLRVYAGWGTAGRRLGGRGDRRLPARRAADGRRAASPPRSTRTARAPRAPTTSGRRRSSPRCSVRTTARGRRAGWRSPTAGTFEHGASTLQLREDPDDLERWFDVPAPAAGGPRPAGAAGPRRQGGRRLERAGDQRPVPGRHAARPPGVRRGGGRRRRAAVATCTSSTAGSAGCRGTASWALRPGCWRTTAASPRASWTCCRRPATPVWLERARDAARHRARPLRAPTTAASSTPPTTPRPWWRGPATPPTTPRRPGCRRWSTRWPTYAALTGSGRHRDAAEAALATVATHRRAGAAVRRLVARRGRHRCSTAPRRSRSSARRARSATRSSSPPAGAAARSSSSPTAPRDDVPLLVGRDAVDGAPGGVRLPGFRVRAPGHRPGAAVTPGYLLFPPGPDRVGTVENPALQRVGSRTVPGRWDSERMQPVSGAAGAGAGSSTAARWAVPPDRAGPLRIALERHLDARPRELLALARGGLRRPAARAAAGAGRRRVPHRPDRRSRGS